MWSCVLATNHHTLLMSWILTLSICSLTFNACSSVTLGCVHTLSHTQICIVVPWQALPSSISRYPVWQVHWTSPLAIWHFWEQPPLFWLQLPSLDRGPVCRTETLQDDRRHMLIQYKYTLYRVSDSSVVEPWNILGRATISLQCEKNSPVTKIFWIFKMHQLISNHLDDSLNFARVPPLYLIPLVPSRGQTMMVCSFQAYYTVAGTQNNYNQSNKFNSSNSFVSCPSFCHCFCFPWGSQTVTTQMVLKVTGASPMLILRSDSRELLSHFNIAKSCCTRSHHTVLST